MTGFRAKVAILSIGNMGVGVARLLIANNYRVITNASDRSQATQDRATNNGIHLVATDVELCNEADYIFSIVPPHESLSTAKRILAAVSSDSNFRSRSNPLYFLDANAISPASAREIGKLFSDQDVDKIRFLDGCIMGRPPTLKEDGTWTNHRMVFSGPHQLGETDGKHLLEVLDATHINDQIGSASGLKMCFSAVSKGFTGLAIQSFTTAHNLGVVSQLKENLNLFNPARLKSIENDLSKMPPKAYRWIHEMEEIAKTFEQEGGFDDDESSFRSIARVFDMVAYSTELGKETTENRKRGKSSEDVALLLSEGTAARKKLRLSS